MDADIYCPKCEWEPPPRARWSCTCGHAWHTFDTYGRCPRCGRVWRETQCLACHRWSPHHDWYHDLPPVDVDEAAREEENSQKLFGKSLKGCACVFCAPQSPAPSARSAAMRLRSRGLLNAKSATLAFFPLTKQLLSAR